MAQTNDNNKMQLEEEREIAYTEFRYNFITIPWNHRTTRSKIGIVFLLTSIFVVTMICVLNNFYLHYKNYRAKSSVVTNHCHLVKMEDHSFVAGIYNLASKELLCVGAVLGPSTVLASGICVKSGPVLIRLGSKMKSISKCKRGFNVEFVESIFHQGVVLQKLVLLISYEPMTVCGSSVIKLGKNIDLNSKAYIFGRSMHSDRYFTRQSVTVEGKGNCTMPPKLKEKLKLESTICVKGLVHCPIQAGDLLIQNYKLYGIASTTVHKIKESNIGYFADLGNNHQLFADYEIDVPEPKVYLSAKNDKYNSSLLLTN